MSTPIYNRMSTMLDNNINLDLSFTMSSTGKDGPQKHRIVFTLPN